MSPQRVPTSRSNIPGNQARSRWQNPWLPLCAGPLKQREKLSLKIRRPATPALHKLRRSTNWKRRRGRTGTRPGNCPDPGAAKDHAVRIEAGGRSTTFARTFCRGKPLRSAGSGDPRSPRSGPGSPGPSCSGAKFCIARRWKRLRPAQQAADAGGSKKTILIAVVLIGVAAAGYFGWTRTQSKESQPAPHAVAPVETGAASLPPSGTEVQPSATADVVEPSGQASSGPGSPSSSTKPSAAVMAQVPGAKTAIRRLRQPRLRIRRPKLTSPRPRKLKRPRR